MSLVACPPQDFVELEADAAAVAAGAAAGVAEADSDFGALVSEPGVEAAGVVSLEFVAGFAEE